MYDRKPSATTNIFLVPLICCLKNCSIFVGSTMASHQNHINLEQVFMIVSSVTYSSIFLGSFDIFFVWFFVLLNPV
jgi:energy-converting hydrogenase Eha subunit F